MNGWRNTFHLGKWLEGFYTEGVLENMKILELVAGLLQGKGLTIPEQLGIDTPKDPLW